MKTHSFLEPRPLFLNAPSSAQEAVASSSSQDSTSDTTPATQADVAKMIQAALKKPAANEDEKPKNTNVQPLNPKPPISFETLAKKVNPSLATLDAVNNRIFALPKSLNTTNAKIIRTLGATVFPPLLVAEATRFLLAGGENAVRSKPVKAISKGIWQRTKQTVGTVWEKGVKKPLLRTKNFAALTAQGAANTAGFGIGAIAGGTAWGIKNLLKGVQYLTTKPLAWVGSTLSSLPFYVGDIIGSTTKALDNIFGAVQTPFRNVDNFFFDPKATKEGKASRMMQAFHIMGHNPATVIDDMKAQVAEWALLSPTLAAAIIQGEKRFGNTKQKLEGVVNVVRDSETVKNIFTSIFSTAKRKAV